MSTEELYTFPESEAALTEWERSQLARGARLLVKVAFRSLPNLLKPASLLTAAAEDNFQSAQGIIWQQANNAFVRQTRRFTDEGYNFMRFHAVNPLNHADNPPGVHSTYSRAVSMFFTHLNGPLGGEKTYLVPPATDYHVGLSALPEEMHVVLDPTHACLGAAAVMYDNTRSHITGRAFYANSHPLAKHAGRIASQLIEQCATDQYRLPWVKPSDSIPGVCGLTAIPSPYYREARSFGDLLPRAL